MQQPQQMDIQLWLNVSGLRQLLPFQNLILTVEYIKVIKISLFLNSVAHRQMKSLKWLSSCLFQGNFLISSFPHFFTWPSEDMKVASISFLVSIVSIHTPFCQCLEFTCGQDPAQNSTVVKVMKRADSLLSLRLHWLFLSAASLAHVGFAFSLMIALILKQT